MYSRYGNTGCRVFKRGVQNWKYFCLKFKIPNGKLRIGVMGRCQKLGIILKMHDCKRLSTFLQNSKRPKFIKPSMRGLDG